MTYVDIVNCGKNYTLQSNDREATNSFSAVHFNQCTDVNLYGISVTISSGINGMILENIKASKNIESTFKDILKAT